MASCNIILARKRAPRISISAYQTNINEAASASVAASMAGVAHHHEWRAAMATLLKYP